MYVYFIPVINSVNDVWTGAFIHLLWFSMGKGQKGNRFTYYFKAIFGILITMNMYIFLYFYVCHVKKYMHKILFKTNGQIKLRIQVCWKPVVKKQQQDGRIHLKFLTLEKWGMFNIFFHKTLSIFVRPLSLNNEISLSLYHSTICDWSASQHVQCVS